MLAPLAWFVVGVAAFTVQRPLWYHHTLVLGIPLTWLSAYGVGGAGEGAQVGWGAAKQLDRAGSQRPVGGCGWCGDRSLRFDPPPLIERQAWQMDVYRPPYVDESSQSTGDLRGSRQ